MKFLVTFILMALLSFTACLYFPWWSIAPACFLVVFLIPQRPLQAFLTGFSALLLLWGGLAFFISNNNHHLLAHKISLLMFQADSPFLLIFITAIIGALVGGFAALAGSFLRKPVN